jgi:hypothetical protein
MIIHSHSHAILKGITMFIFIKTTEHPWSFTLSSIYTSFDWENGPHPPQTIIKNKTIMTLQNRFSHAFMVFIQSWKVQFFPYYPLTQEVISCLQAYKYIHIYYACALLAHFTLFIHIYLVLISVSISGNLITYSIHALKHIQA